MTKSRSNSYLDKLKFWCSRLEVTQTYGRNLTLLAAMGKLPRCYYRDAEIEEIQVNRNRFTKPNILLTGPSGCGKTAIVEGLAQAIEEDLYKRWSETGVLDISAELPVVFELNPASLVGGSKYRGEFEERMKKLLDEVTERSRKVILFIDEAHTLSRIGVSNDGGLGAGDILKPALARGDLVMIAATTDHEYTQYMAKDTAFVRRFSRVAVQPISSDHRVDCAIRIIEEYSLQHKMPCEIENKRLESFLTKILESEFQDSAFPYEFVDAVDLMFARARYAKKPVVGMSELRTAIRDKTS